MEVTYAAAKIADKNILINNERVDHSAIKQHKTHQTLELTNVGAQIHDCDKAYGFQHLAFNRRKMGRASVMFDWVCQGQKMP